MKVCLILCLLCVGIHAEKKINLEDIERDNLRAEGKGKTEDIRAEETKYLTKPEVSQQQYQLPSQYRASTSIPSAYVTPSPIKNIQSEEYLQPNRYAVKETYQQNGVQSENNVPLQYYNEYQRQPSFSGKGIGQNIYETQQFVYQPEISVGNQYQAVQQKAVSEKYAKNVNKETVYVDIPMTQLLSYYPNLDFISGRNGGLPGKSLLHQIASVPAPQISIPVYNPHSQKQFVSINPSYQVQYAPKYNAIPATYTTKISKGSAYTTPVTSKKFGSSPLLSSQVDVQPDQSYAQGKKLLYTQAYVAQPQSQYIPQLVYTQPAAVYTHSAPVYADLYSRIPEYVQDNSLHANGNHYATQSQQLYAEQTVGEDLPKQLLRQQSSHGAPQNYAQVPEEPINHFQPPSVPAQNFKHGVTQLAPVHSQDAESVPVQNHVSYSEPRSLLDSYVPSKVIAAQDAARYRERPIKLEGGFLPSKENFYHKKRKSE